MIYVALKLRRSLLFTFIFYFPIILNHGICNCRIQPSVSSWFGLMLMLARALGVLFMASQINAESKKTVKILNRVPSNLWSSEVERFSSEVVCSRVALSGCKFFHLNYDLILAVAGTITSYELFLMQLEL